MHIISDYILYFLLAFPWTYVHGRVDLSNSFVLCGELIDLHTVTD